MILYGKSRIINFETTKKDPSFQYRNRQQTLIPFLLLSSPLAPPPSILPLLLPPLSLINPRRNVSTAFLPPKKKEKMATFSTIQLFSSPFSPFPPPPPFLARTFWPFAPFPLFSFLSPPSRCLLKLPSSGICFPPAEKKKKLSRK